MDNKKFWQTIKPFITNKSSLSNSHIMLLENNSLISVEKELVTLFNTHYINIVEKSSGLKPNSINFNKAKDKSALIKEIIEQFCQHPSIVAIKNANPNISNFLNFKEVNETDIEKVINKLDSKTSTGEDKIPTKLVIFPKDYLVKPLKHAIISSIRNNTFPNKAKYAAVSPLDKGVKDKTSVTNYRPVSVLNVFSKCYEKIMKKQITHFMEENLSYNKPY